MIPPVAPRRGRPARGAPRYDAARAEGVPLDPTSEPVEGVDAYPTDYAAGSPAGHDRRRPRATAGRAAPPQPRTSAGASGSRTSTARHWTSPPASDRARRASAELDLPTIYRVADLPAAEPRQGRPARAADRRLAPPAADARSQRQEAEGASSLDHVLTVDPIRAKTNPSGTKTNPISGKTNPLGHVNASAGSDSYVLGRKRRSSGRQLRRSAARCARRSWPAKGRRPVVAVLDTGCGDHPWLPDDIVTRYPDARGRGHRRRQPAHRPRAARAISPGPSTARSTSSSGHGTFIAGIVRQVCPEADIISIRVADSQGNGARRSTSCWPCARS